MHYISSSSEHSGTAGPGDRQEWLSKAELASRTGLSPATIQRLKDADRIPYVQPAGKGGKLLFPPDALTRAFLPPPATNTTSTPAPCPAAVPAPGGQVAVHPDPSDAGSGHLAGRRPGWMQL